MTKTKPALLASLLALAIAGTQPTQAQQSPKISEGVVRLGFLLDMSGIYADVTGIGSATAARMAVEDFGGKVLGAPIEIEVADHYNKPDIAGAKAREWLDTGKVDALLDVAASATAFAALEIAKERNKIAVFNGPGAVRLTNESCTAISAHWAYDTYSLSRATASAVVKGGGDSWFFITADYAFGHELERDASEAVKAAGGKVVGSVRAPVGTADFSSFLLRAQGSGAKIVALANAGADLVTSVKQAAEFGLASSGQRMAGLLVYDQDVNTLGLKATQGMMLTSAFYWDMNEETRAFAKRFHERVKKMPNMSQAGVYSTVLHYLKAVEKAGTDETTAVMKTMREMPVNDVFTKSGRIREDGRMIHDMYLLRVKKPEDSKSAWDLYDIVATIPGEEAFQPLAQSRCPLVKK
jgi:branched-chain amino acid transport system substrate-binding protein